MLSKVTAIAGLVLIAGCASTPLESVKVVTEAKGSSSFSLGAPAVSKSHNGQHVAGRVCRQGRSTLLSPPSIRVEHLAAGGQVLNTDHAYVPEIYSARDQTCADYHVKVQWTLSPGDIVRACFEHGAACPHQADSKAVVKAPAGPASR